MSDRLLSLVLLGSVACSSNQEPAAAAAATAGAHHKPCEFLTRVDAEAATGLPLPDIHENLALDSCAYLTQQFLGATLSFGPWDQVKMAAGPEPSASRRAAVTGVGDEALWRGHGHLYVRTGERGFLLVLDSPDVNQQRDEGLARVKAFALKILPKIVRG